MRQTQSGHILLFILLGLAMGTTPAFAQTGMYEEVAISPGLSFQTLEGFGASLAYYENWLIAHPKKAEIYEAVFGELSLDILRVRNAYDYDAGMIDRVAEFAQAAQTSLGRPIAILSSSWGPPGYLKSNNDRTNGGTLKFTAGENGVEFDYAGFARWWKGSLDEYNSHGIYPAYISIQNEPDWAASWETCILKPSETVTASDTIAGYNKALDAVYDTIVKRDRMPRILGGEASGIGYNSVENYTNAMDVGKIYGIAHHLYNGMDENDPWSSTDFSKVGNYHPEIPHFQTEFSGGDWFSLGGQIYMSLYHEKAVAYLYWDLIWNGGGLVSLEFPWNPSQWTDPQKGYARTKDFYAFKQFSAFIHPGWQRIGTGTPGNGLNILAFASPGMDSAALVLINRSATDSLGIHLGIDGYSIDESSIFITSESRNCAPSGSVVDSLMKVPPRSIATVQMSISELKTDTAVQQALTIGEAFDFNVQDEFHLTDNEGYRPPNAERITVLGKYYSENQDTVFYTLFYDVYSSQYDEKIGDLVYDFNTFTKDVLYTNLDSSIYDYYRHLKYSELLENQENDTSFFFVYDSIHYQNAELCDSQVHGFQVQLNEFEPDLYHTEFGRGLGLTLDEFIEGSSGSSDPLYSRKLFYYKKGSFSCGTPDLMNHIHITSESADPFKIVQNRDDYEISIHPLDPSTNYTIELYSLSGKRLLVRQDLRGFYKLGTEEFSPGIYVLSIVSPGCGINRKIVF